jgi:L-aspartate semialdehyde sulfurtransferase ferredoxin
MVIRKKIVLTFPHAEMDRPVVYHLVKDFDLVFNILRANITQEEEGKMVLELSGKKEDFEKGMEFLKQHGVTVEALQKDVSWLDAKCIQCGVCITICPTDALKIDRKTMLISFDPDKCIACELCVKPCPARAFEVKLY